MTIREFLISFNEVVNIALDNKIVGLIFYIGMILVAVSAIRSVWNLLDIFTINQHAERDDINNLNNSKEIETNGKR